MVEKYSVVKIYRSRKEYFAGCPDEIEELNKVLREMGINCKVTADGDEDGEYLIFEKTED